jgi:subtilisin-like proprotein convertase family protein
MKRCCDQIDTAGGNYDANGHSDAYGYGRLNAKRAIELATPAAAAYTALHTAVQSVAIKDLKTSKIVAQVGDKKALKNVKISVNIEHTYIGDLVVRVIPPTATGIGPIVLHDREGGTTNNLNRSYDAASTPALTELVGKSPQGAWTLDVTDKANQDTGQILRFMVELSL